MEVERYLINLDSDIVSTLREKLRKFIRELHRLTTYVKIIVPINKSTLSADVKKRMQKILHDEILTADKIDQVKIMKQLVILEKDIYNSIMNKETRYYKPDNIGSLNSYKKNPLEVNGIVAAMVYNELKDDNMPAIDLETRNKIIKIKININKRNIESVKDEYPEAYAKLNAILDHPSLGAKCSTMALPLDVKVPEWILPFVDFTSIINDALKNFPIESIGLKRLDNDNVNYSNIIQL